MTNETDTQEMPAAFTPDFLKALGEAKDVAYNMSANVKGEAAFAGPAFVYDFPLGAQHSKPSAEAGDDPGGIEKSVADELIEAVRDAMNECNDSSLEAIHAALKSGNTKGMTVDSITAAIKAAHTNKEAQLASKHASELTREQQMAKLWHEIGELDESMETTERRWRNQGLLSDETSRELAEAQQHARDNPHSEAAQEHLREVRERAAREAEETARATGRYTPEFSKDATDYRRNIGVRDQKYQDALALDREDVARENTNAPERFDSDLLALTENGAPVQNAAAENFSADVLVLAQNDDALSQEALMNLTPTRLHVPDTASQNRGSVRA